MKKAIDRARESGDSLGGAFEIVVTGVPPGLGSHVQWDRKLNARFAMALMSIQAIKGVAIGMGFDVASTPGSKVHDEIFYGRASSGKNGYWPISRRFFRKTNNAGGIEGGMSNGEPIVLTAAMKPIPTLYKPLRSVDIVTKKPLQSRNRKKRHLRGSGRERHSRGRSRHRDGKRLSREVRRRFGNRNRQKLQGIS